MKGTGVFLTLLLGCLLYQAAANEEQSSVETRRLVHSPVADYYPGGGYGGGGYGNKGYGGGFGGYGNKGYGGGFGGYGNNFYGGGGYGGYGGIGYGPRPYGGYGGYGFGPRCYGGYGGYGFGPGGYGGYGPRGYGGYGGYGPRGCRYGYPRRNGHVFVNVNLHRLPFVPGFHPMGKIPFFNQYFNEGFPGFGGGFHASPFLPGFPSMGKIPFFNNHFLGGFPVFGGGAHASPFLGKIPFFNRYFNYFPSTHQGYFYGGSFPFLGKSSFGFHNDFSHFGGGPYSGGYGKGYGYH